MPTIYSEHRKIWIQHYGPIPKDSDGRSYEIHHINGDPTDNRIENLMCVPIKEHYNIHYKQEDWGACLLIGRRMKIKPSTFSEAIGKSSRKRVKEKTHNWLKENGGGEWQSEYQLKLIEENDHNFKNKKYEDKRLEGLSKSVEKRKVEGSYHMIEDNPNNKRLEGGTHNFLGSTQNEKMLAEGKHPSQKKKTCPHCYKVIDTANYKRWHGDKCKMNGKKKQSK